jgi:O-acetylserine/cysteine efflux transporter
MKLGMPAGLASLVIQAQAFFTLLIAVIFLKEKWYFNQAFGLFLASSGMLIIGLHHDGSVTTIGFLLTIFSSLFWAIANIITKKISQGLSNNHMFSLIVWIAGVSVLPLMLLSLYMEGIAVWQKAWDSLNGVAVFAVFFQAYFSTLGGYGFWFNLLSKYPASIVSPFSLLVPIIGMSSCGLVLGETLSIGQISGAVLVMAGLIINVFGQKLYSKFRVSPATTTEQ